MLRTRTCTVLRLVAITGALILLPKAVQAHRFGGPNDPCERRIGTSLIHITLYQPQFDPDAEYCDEIPRAGNTVLVVDILGDELRKIPLGVEVASVGGSSTPRRVLSIPPKAYRRGVADAQVMLEGGRSYLTRVVIGQGPGARIISFPIRVAPWYRAFVKPALLVLAVLALIAISVIRYYLAVGETPEPNLREIGRPGSRRTVQRIDRQAARGGSLLFVLALAAMLSISACSRRPQTHRSLPDVRVVDDHGNQMSLGSLRGKIVLLDFIHVGCPGVCSNLVNKFGQVADSLGPALGSRVVLLSVTNDPDHDNPQELLKLARSSQADMKGWLFVTGKLADVNRVIKAFGLTNERLPDGSPNHITQVFLLGPDLRQVHEFQGMVMNSDAVVAQIRDLEGQGSVVVGNAGSSASHY